MRLTPNRWRLKNLEKELQKADRLHIQKEKNKMDKSIDLGKLQNDLLKAQALYRSATLVERKAEQAYERALAARDKASKARAAANISVDTAKRAMVEAARTVASS